MEGRRLRRTRTTLKTRRGQACLSEQSNTMFKHSKSTYAPPGLTRSPPIKRGMAPSRCECEIPSCSDSIGMSPSPGAAVSVDVADIPVRCLDRQVDAITALLPRSPGLSPCSCEAKRRRKLPPGATHGMVSESHWASSRFSFYCELRVAVSWALADSGTCHVQRRGG